ncbi:MAG TPA: response regulator [Candidatus Enterocloster excrementigallinarum]|uniref:Stage 0 sporulation protein A homolog n=1 Tax=Candidatus Enterocloster excrementigallinarum TaxID=2838558 RepID=A0A9D2PS29_9FIRM|nr:response regulator [Candidatus Enterocloster excrementigallinarum]
MDLYRIILVDDEEEVRTSIIKKIDWKSAGFQVVGDAENGQDALEKIEQLEPDVVMTDIRMPYMDGLTLIEKIRQKYPSMKILIFSGFDDFEYAKQAIKLNVTEYILKPVNVEELTEILERVKANLDDEIEQRRNVDRLRERYQNSLPILKELFLNDLARGNVPPGQEEARLKEYGVDILGAKQWLAAVVSVEQEEQTEERVLSQHQELIPFSVRQLIEDHLKEAYRFVLFNSTAGLTLVAALDEEEKGTGIIDQLEDICKECRKILEVTVTIGVGHRCSDLGHLSVSCQSAVDALGYKAIVGAGKTIYINDVEPVGRGRLQMDVKDESELINAVKFGPKDKIRSVVHGLVDRMEEAKVHLRQYQLFMLSISNCLLQMMQQYDLDPGDLLSTQKHYSEILSFTLHRDEFEEWIIETACQMNEMMNQERDNTTRRVILEAKRYIQENYQNPELSVEMLCREFHMSPAYFSTVFKRETGQSYVGYLTDVRLAKAVELLETTDDKTYVIAEKVGYQEQNYFSYVFKKRFGVSPTKYRGAK